MALKENDYLERILRARVYDVAEETPLDPLPNLSRRMGNALLLKREDTQPVFSFKLRGAYNKMVNLDAAALARGVICASAGNHAQGVALSAQKLGCRAVIVMPGTTPAIKVEAVRRRGGEVVLSGESFDEALARAIEIGQAEGLTFIHPYDDPDVIAGQGTIGMEILRQHTKPIEAIFCCVGGGGLIAGVAAYVKRVRPEIKVVGVEARDAAGMDAALRAGKPVALEQVGLFADGAAVRQVGEETFRLCQHTVDEMVLVDNDAICAAIKDVFEDTRSILEPAGALAVAGMKQYARDKVLSQATLIAVASGANMNFDRLRFVAERAGIGEQREAVFAVQLRERPGAYKELVRLLSPRNITEFNYRYHDATVANVFVGVQVTGEQERRVLLDHLIASGLETLDLTDDEVSKLHVRYMVGGHPPVGAAREILYRFTFPERPGALARFLDGMSPNWNISLFHYRNHGADFARILCAFQVPDGEMDAFRTFLDALGYEHTEETDNPAYKLFLAR